CAQCLHLHVSENGHLSVRQLLPGRGARLFRSQFRRLSRSQERFYFLIADPLVSPLSDFLCHHPNPFAPPTSADSFKQLRERQRYRRSRNIRQEKVLWETNRAAAH